MRILATAPSGPFRSNPASVTCWVTFSAGSAAFTSSSTLLANACTASPVGRVFRITTISAELFPTIMVPFLNDPTWRTSSI
uniref:Putative secreted protein n=1 Tax=Ixodes ricinus TaxID=34613 RepID=A0A6B0TVZ0_IXORI